MLGCKITKKIVIAQSSLLTKISPALFASGINFGLIYVISVFGFQIYL